MSKAAQGYWSGAPVYKARGRALPQTGNMNRQTVAAAYTVQLLQELLAEQRKTHDILIWISDHMVQRRPPGPTSTRWLSAAWGLENATPNVPEKGRVPMWLSTNTGERRSGAPRPRSPRTSRTMTAKTRPISRCWSGLRTSPVGKDAYGVSLFSVLTLREP